MVSVGLVLSSGFFVDLPPPLQHSEIHERLNAERDSVELRWAKSRENYRRIASDSYPRGPKDQKNSRFRSRLKISIENEIFERATHRVPIFWGKSRRRD